MLAGGVDGRCGGRTFVERSGVGAGPVRAGWSGKRILSSNKTRMELDGGNVEPGTR